MAVQKHVFATGRFGNLIFYKRGDLFCARTIPAKVRQTKSTKAKAKSFGTAARMGKLIRAQLLPVIPFPADGKMQNRLVSTIFEWLNVSGSLQADLIKNLSMLEHFQFSGEGVDFVTRWKPRFSVSAGKEGVQIEIAAFISNLSILAPAHTKSVRLMISAGAIDTARGLSTGSSAADLVFAFDEKEVAAQKILLKLPLNKGNLVVVGARLEFSILKKGELQINEQKKFMPAAIIAALNV